MKTDILFEGLKEAEKPHRSLLVEPKQTDDEFHRRCRRTAYRHKLIAHTLLGLLKAEAPCALERLVDRCVRLRGGGSYSDQWFEYTPTQIEAKLIELHSLGQVLFLFGSWGLPPKDFTRKLDHQLSLYGLTELSDFSRVRHRCGCDSHLTHDTTYHMMRWLKGKLMVQESNGEIQKLWEYVQRYPFAAPHVEEMRRLLIGAKLAVQKRSTDRSYGQSRYAK